MFTFHVHDAGNHRSHKLHPITKSRPYDTGSPLYYLTINANCLSRAPGLIRVVLGVLHDGHEGQPGLLSSRDDLIGWQDESVSSVVSQLEGVGVLDALVVGPVDGATACLV